MMLKNQCSIPQSRDPFQNLFRQLFGSSLSEPDDSNEQGEQSVRRFTPRTNISETATSYVFAFDLPGVLDQDIQVELHEKTLKVTAERKDTRDAAAEGTRFHRLEHRYGQHSRAISLPNNAAGDGIEALYQAGVLTVTVPKREDAQPAKITVRTA